MLLGAGGLLRGPNRRRERIGGRCGRRRGRARSLRLLSRSPRRRRRRRSLRGLRRWRRLRLRRRLSLLTQLRSWRRSYSVLAGSARLIGHDTDRRDRVGGREFDIDRRMLRSLRCGLRRQHGARRHPRFIIPGRGKLCHTRVVCALVHIGDDLFASLQEVKRIAGRGLASVALRQKSARRDRSDRPQGCARSERARFHRRPCRDRAAPRYPE